jgi:hypothetical protein
VSPRMGNRFTSFLIAAKRSGRGEPMRVLRIAAARQLVLFAGPDDPAARWDELPERVKAQVLAVLATMIAKDMLSPARAREVAP